MTHIITLQLTLTRPKVILTREIVWTIPLSFEGNNIHFKKKKGGWGHLKWEFCLVDFYPTIK